jgi:hypothetical protein
LKFLKKKGNRIMSKDYHDLRICIDCALYLANGEVPPDDDDSEWKPEDIDKVWPKTLITLGHTFETMKTYMALWPDCDVDAWKNEDDIPENLQEIYEEGSFSSRPCDACHSHLAGERFPATAHDA